MMAILLWGCGSPGAPQPPSLKLPTPLTDLSASRSGNQVALHWTMPRRATDRVMLTGDQRVVVCRSIAPAPCSRIGEVLLLAGAPANYTDTLPASLTGGPPRLLTYTVLLQNHSKRDAGPSNAAYSAAGAAPPVVSDVSAKAEPGGIVLRWQLASATPPQAGSAEVSAQLLLRLGRTRVLAPGENPRPTTQENQAGVPQPIDQTLEVAAPASSTPVTTLQGGWTLDHAIDKDAALNRTYRYTVQRVARFTLAGHTMEVSSAPSAAANVEARDVFPPSVPRGLQAVGDAEGDAIDLSWTPDSDPDTAGYFVYRRQAGTSALPVRVSGTAPIVDSAWRDAAPAPGVHFAYSVSAVDSSGNESARSGEAVESVTPVSPDQKPPPRPKSSSGTEPHP